MGENNDGDIDKKDDGADGAGDGNADDNANNDGADDGGKNADQDGSKNKDDGKSKKDDGDDDTPPPVRKSAADYYAERQERKAAKAANSQKDDGDGKNGADDDADNDDDVDPEDEKLINKVVNKKFAPVLEKIAAQEDTQEAKDFFESQPEFKPFENKIIKWWKDPSRRHLPIATVALEAVGYDKLIQLGAQRERLAADKAKKSNSGGGSSGNDSGKKGAWDMSKEEFAAEKERVLRSRQ